MNTRHLPGPSRGFLGMKNVRRYQEALLTFPQELQREYGDIVKIDLGPYRNIFVFHPEQVREVGVTKAKHFQRFHRTLQILKQWNGNSLLVSEGDEWARQRRLMQASFAPQRLHGYSAAMVAKAHNLRCRLHQAAREQPSRTRSVRQDMMELTLEIVTRTLFSVDVGSEKTELAAAVAASGELVLAELMAPVVLPRWIPTRHNRRKNAALQVLDDFIFGIVRERRKRDLETGDLLSSLFAVVDEQGNGFSDRQIRDQAMNLFLAGHDTTASGLTWLWYNLARNPAWTTAAQNELDSVLHGRLPSAADVPRLTLLERIVKESLRLHPPAIGMILREVVQDVEIGGYPLRRGDLVQPLAFVTHRDPRWFPEPETFNPDRFLPENEAKLPPCAYAPFGVGPRMCIGHQFAMLEMTLIAATLLQNLTPVLAIDHPPVEPMVTMSLWPQPDIKLRWELRTSPVNPPLRTGSKMLVPETAARRK